MRWRVAGWTLKVRATSLESVKKSGVVEECGKKSGVVLG